MTCIVDRWKRLCLWFTKKTGVQDTGISSARSVSTSGAKEVGIAQVLAENPALSAGILQVLTTMNDTMNGPQTAQETLSVSKRNSDIIDVYKENELNATEKSFGDEMSEGELAKHFNETTPVQTAKSTTNKEMTSEEIKEWERAQDNSNDIYKVSARIKNLARKSVRANLTQQGEMVCNSFTHLIKAFYDFAETINDKEIREKLIELTRKQEGVPADLIVALMAGVKASK